MKSIKSIEKITGIYSTWKPSDMAFIKAVEWSMDNLVIVFYCQLRNCVVEWPDMSKDFFEISITFKNVANLKLDINGIGLHQISGFDILDISDDGLERINFQIEDYEDDSVNFICQEIEVNEVSNSLKIKVA